MSSSSYYDFNGRYFVPGHGISRQIMLSQIHIYLGPRASARPYTYRGREGYLIDSPGPVLTVVRHLPKYEHYAKQELSQIIPQGPNQRPQASLRPVRAAGC